MVKPKKHFGQHFLIDKSIAENTAKLLIGDTPYSQVIEIGPGTGALTDHLLNLNLPNLKVIEIENDAADYIREKYPNLPLIHGDFLHLNLGEILQEQTAIIGNYPYNISSQILFKIIENRHKIPLAGGMFQKEVAARACASEGNKTYGIVSILLQAYYKAEYLFDVPPSSFNPPPKVDSGVIKLTRLEHPMVSDDIAKQFKTIVKVAFNQRRKTLRNGLKALCDMNSIAPEWAGLRAEALSVEQFVELTKRIHA